jgi:hypothetical protein
MFLKTTQWRKVVLAFNLMPLSKRLERRGAMIFFAAILHQQYGRIKSAISLVGRETKSWL